jgi:hypothetical protein
MQRHQTVTRGRIIRRTVDHKRSQQGTVFQLGQTASSPQRTSTAPQADRIVEFQTAPESIEQLLKLTKGMSHL